MEDAGTTNVDDSAAPAGRTAEARPAVIAEPPSLRRDGLAPILFAYGIILLVLFPVAIATHLHLMADGAHFLLQLAYCKCVAATGQAPARYAHHYLMQFPAVTAIKGGADLALVSRIFGSCLFYLPALCYVTATILFLRARLRAHAILVTLLYCILVCFTSLFIISESHLAAGLFVLTVAVIRTANLGRPAALVALLILGLLTSAIYEFWAIFFPAAAVLLVLRARPARHTRLTLALVAIVLLVYAAGTVHNVRSTYAPNLRLNRVAMFSDHLLGILPQFAAAVLLFSLAILHNWFGPAGAFRGPRFLRPLCCRLDREPILLASALLALAAALWMTFMGAFVAGEPYGLRSLNLVLPLLFAGSLILERDGAAADSTRGRPAPADPPAAKFPFLAGVIAGCLLFSSFTYLYRAPEWIQFRGVIVSTCQQNRGYIPFPEVRGLNWHYGWSWCYPTMSLLFQGIEHRPVTSLIYVTDIDWQPMGPDDYESAIAVARSLNLTFTVPPPP